MEERKRVDEEEAEKDEEYREARRLFACALFEHAKKWDCSGHKEFVEILKPQPRFLEREQLIILGKQSYLISQAVADYLIPEIRTLDFGGRIELGEEFGYWRIWRNLVRVPGLSAEEIDVVSYRSGSSDVEPW